MDLSIRPALLRDIPDLLAVINGYASQGIMLPRTELEMAENVRDFMVATNGTSILGCGALHIYTPLSAEIRSLAVMPETKGTGIGRLIVEALEADARRHALQALFAFTYSPGFFEKLGFDEVDRGELPLKAWKDCMRCPKFQACDEIAMRKWLVDDELRAPDSIRLPQAGLTPGLFVPIASVKPVQP
jgi:amino-acid N-acetyltransferase